MSAVASTTTPGVLLNGTFLAVHAAISVLSNPAAAWAMFDLGRQTLTFHRVPYDHEATAAKIIAAGLPRALGERLLVGA